MKPATILVVDYEPNNLQKVKSLLESSSYKVETATDGLMAIKRFEEIRPNLVLLSAMLPKLHGFEACQKIKATSNGESVPVIIMTNIYKGRKYRHDALTKYGASEYLEKPFDDETLLHHIKTLLEPGAVPPKSLESPAAPEPEQDEDIPELLDDDDEIPELLDEEESGERSVMVAKAAAKPSAPAPSKGPSVPPPSAEADETIAVAGPASDVEEEVVEEVEEIIGDDEQTVTVDPDVARAAISAATAQPPADDNRGLTAREIFSDVIQDVEQEVGGTLKRIALERAAMAREGASFLETGHAAAEPAPAPARPAPPTPKSSPNATVRLSPPPPLPPPAPAPTREVGSAAKASTAKTEEMVVPKVRTGELPAPVPAKPRTGELLVPRPPRARTGELPTIGEIMAQVAPPKSAPDPSAAARASQDVFKQKLEETLTGLGIPVKRDAKKKEPTQRMPRTGTGELPAPLPVAVEVRAPAPVASQAALHAPMAPAVVPVTAPTLQPAALEEAVFGNYTLLEKIASGGMAELFKAKMQGVEGFRKLVAIKRILPHLTDNEEFVHMFIDEAKLAAQLNHQNIAHIFDLGRIEKFYYIAMEYVAGKDLRAILKHLGDKGEKLGVELAVLVASKVAAALDYAHRKKDFDGRDLNIVHRDISPQNVLISYEGEVKLVDFGIAKAVSRSSQTESGTVKGKLLYMSPEQARGVEIDKRSDIFSLGVVLYETLTGEKLFLDETEMDIIRRVRDCKVSSPRRLNPAIPKELDLVVMTALEKRPEDRYQNAYKMQKDLENIMYAWESTPTSVNLAQFMAEEFRGEAATADMDQTAIAVAPAAPPPPPPAAPPAPPKALAASPRSHGKPAATEEEEEDATMLAPDKKALEPPPKPAPAPPPHPKAAAVPPPVSRPVEVKAPAAPPQVPAKPAAPQPPKAMPTPVRAPAPSRAPSAAKGVIMPDTGMIRLGKEEAVQELEGKAPKGSSMVTILALLGLVGLVAVAVIAYALWTMYGPKGVTPTPAPTVATGPATTEAPPATTAAPAPSVSPSIAASPSPAPTTAAAPPPTTVAPPPTPTIAAAEAARLSRVEDNLRSMNANLAAQDWEATVRSAIYVLKDDPKNAAALSAKSDAEAKIAEKKRLEAEQNYAAALADGRKALDAQDVALALQKADEALKWKPRDKDAIAFRKQAQEKKREIEKALAPTPPPATATATATPATPPKTPKATAPATPPPPATPSPAEEWAGKIKAALAAPTPDVAAIEEMFRQAQDAGVPTDVLQPLYTDFQKKKPKPVENSFVPFTELDVRPDVVSKVTPNYSRQADLQKIQGTVLVEATIDANGDVEESKVTRGLGFGLDENAEKAVKKFKFKPGEKQGVKVKTKMIISVAFKRS